MKPRRIYYRKKGKSIVIEGKKNKKSILIFTLPKPEKLIEYLGSSKFTKTASFFTEEKWQKIQEKLRRLDYRAEKNQNEK